MADLYSEEVEKASKIEKFALNHIFDNELRIFSSLLVTCVTILGHVSVILVMFLVLFGEKS